MAPYAGSDPCGRELLLLDGDHLDLALQLALLHEQRALQFLVVTQREERDADASLARALHDLERVVGIRPGDAVVVQPRDLGLVVLRDLCPVLARQRVGERVGVSRVAFAQDIVGLCDREDVVLVLDLVHVVRDGDPHVVGRSGRRGLLEGRLSEGELAPDVKLVVEVAAQKQLFACFIEQQHAVVPVPVRPLGGKVSADDDADRIVGPVLALEDVLVVGRRDIHDVAHLGIVDRQRDERLVAGPCEVEPFLGVEGRHRAEGVRVVGYESRHLEPLVVGVGDRDSCVVADHLDRVSGSGQLLVDAAVIVGSAGESGPVDHPARRSLEDGHYLGFRVAAEVVLLKLRHVLVGQEVDRPRVFGHHGTERTRLRALGREIGRCGGDEQPEGVEAEKRHVLHAVAVGVHRAGDDLLHGRDLGVEAQGDIAVGHPVGCGCCGPVLLAGVQCGQYSECSRCCTYHSFYHGPCGFDSPGVSRPFGWYRHRGCSG